MSKIRWLTSHCLLLVSLLLMLKASEVIERRPLLPGEVKKLFQNKQPWKKFVVNVSKGYDENIRNLIVICKDHYFKNREGKCEPCQLCVPPQTTLFYCSSDRDTVCLQLKGKKSNNFLWLKQSLIEIFSNWKPDATQIKNSQINFKMLPPKRRKRQNRQNKTKSFEPTVELTQSPLPTSTTNSRARHPGFELPETADPSTGTSSWVYIAIGVGLVVMLVIIFMATMLYRRRKRSQRNTERPPETVSHLDSYMACPTIEIANEKQVAYGIAFKRAANSRRDYHDSGDEYELRTLTRTSENSLRNVGSGHKSCDFINLSRPSNLYEINRDAMENIVGTSFKQFQPLPRVKMLNSVSSTFSSDTTSSFLLSCVGHSEPEVGNCEGHVFHQCSDDKLRGGNIEFERCYEDVFVNNDLDSDRSRKSRSAYQSRRSSTEGRRDRNYQKNYPSKFNTNRSSKEHCSRNVQKVSSHHSARSYISIPPTIPSEKYVEAGTDNLSIHSELSTPPGKMEWLTKSFKFFPKNEFGSYQSSLGTQTDSNVAEPKCKTVFGTQWQFGGSFSSSGGMIQAKNSDVALHVPKNAIPRGEFVDIYGAVFIETQEIRKKFEFPAGESLITPLVEYHAEPSAHFQRPLCIQMPHSLPDEFETSHIKVYTFTTDDRGRILSLRCLPFINKVNDDKNSDGFWEKSSDAHTIDITTKHFSGYFCSLCETSSLPSICTMVFGSHVQMNPTRREVRVMLYIWDRRLTIRDYLERFRKLESDVDRQLLTDMQVPLLDSASSESRLVMKMEPMGEDKERTSWRHICRPNSNLPLFKPLQVRKLSEIVHCCRQTDPIRVEWAMENVPHQIPSSVFQCCIDIMHTHESTQDYETAMREDSDDLIRTFYIRDLKVTPHEPKFQSQKFQRVDIERTLSELMEPEETEKLCKEYGITARDIGNFRKKFSASDILQINLVEECVRRHGQESFLEKLPRVLEKLQMRRVLNELEDRKVKFEGNDSSHSNSSVNTTLDTTAVKICSPGEQLDSITQAKALNNPSELSSKKVNNSSASRGNHRMESCQECSDLGDNLNHHKHSKASTISCDGSANCGHCAEKTRTSSSGSDSVLKDSSVPSDHQSNSTMLSSSLIAEPGTHQSYSVSGKYASSAQTIPVNRNNIPSCFEPRNGYAEMPDDLQISDSGPHAIPHYGSRMPPTHGDRSRSSSSSKQTLLSKQKSRSKERSPDLDQTQKKELDGVQTMV